MLPYICGNLFIKLYLDRYLIINILYLPYQVELARQLTTSFLPSTSVLHRCGQFI